MAFAFEDDGAATAPDELEGEEGEAFAVDDEIGGAPFAAAADEDAAINGGESFPIGKKETARAGDLA